MGAGDHGSTAKSNKQLFQKTQVQFPVPTPWSHPSVTPVPGLSHPLLASAGKHACGTQIYMKTNTHAPIK